MNLSNYQHIVNQALNWGKWARDGGASKRKCGSAEGNYIRESEEDMSEPKTITQTMHDMREILKHDKAVLSLPKLNRIIYIEVYTNRNGVIVANDLYVRKALKLKGYARTYAEQVRLFEESHKMLNNLLQTIKK